MLSSTVKTPDTGAYNKLKNFDPAWGRISVRIYSYQYERLLEYISVNLTASGSNGNFQKHAVSINR